MVAPTPSRNHSTRHLDSPSRLTSPTTASAVVEPLNNHAVRRWCAPGKIEGREHPLRNAEGRLVAADIDDEAAPRVILGHVPGVGNRMAKLRKHPGCSRPKPMLHANLDRTVALSRDHGRERVGRPACGKQGNQRRVRRLRLVEIEFRLGVEPTARIRNHSIDEIGEGVAIVVADPDVLGVGRQLHGDVEPYDRPMSESPRLRLAATAIPVRPCDDGFEVLMVQRAPDLSFGGLWTFPGGAIEAADGPIPDVLDEVSHDWRDVTTMATAATAAARETSEETGLQVDPAAMAWFSHWIPPRKGPPKRFATWFFVAPEATGSIVLDERENTAFRWLTPSDALADAEVDRLPLSVPTWVTLDDLMQFESMHALIDHTATNGPRIHHTVAAPAGDLRVLMWSGDDGYDAVDPSMGTNRNRVTANAALKVVSRERTS